MRKLWWAIGVALTVLLLAGVVAAVLDDTPPPPIPADRTDPGDPANWPQPATP